MISVKNLFPNKKGINTTKLKLAQNSIYSVTRPSEAEKITKIFNKIFDRKKNLVVIDGTSNVGGDVINFAMNPLVKKVYAIEFNEETFKLLKHNVGVYQLESKVDLIHGNSSKKIFENNLKADLLYLDPPWGGPKYKEKCKLSLFLGKKNVYEVLSEVIKKNLVKHILLKVPFNFDITKMMRRANMEEIEIYQIKTKYSAFYLLHYKL